MMLEDIDIQLGEEVSYQNVYEGRGNWLKREVPKPVVVQEGRPLVKELNGSPF